MAGIMTGIAYASVIFVGDTRSTGFGATKKIMSITFQCQNGQEWYKGKCVSKCDRSVYLYEQSDTEKTYEPKRGATQTCSDVWGTYFAYISCDEGWELKNKYCEISSCANYNFNESPSTVQGTVGKCKRGDDWVYKYTACNEGWDYDGVYQCNIHNCPTNTYPYTSGPSADAGTIINCKTGTATRYGYSECRTGWDKSNGYCNIHVCDSATYPYATAQSSDAGTIISCKTGTDMRYGFTACNDGWGFANNQCTMNSCDGFNSTNASIVGCQANASCQKGPTTMYQCTTLYTGYAKNSDNNCTMSCAFTATALPSNCSAASNCQRADANGTKTYYATTCATCSGNYYLSNGSCSACTWGGKTLTSCPSNCNCSSEACGGTTKYSISSAKSGYTVSGNTCIPSCTWNGYTLTSCPTGCNCASNTCGGVTKYSVSSAKDGYYVSGNSCPANACDGFTSSSSSISYCASTSSCKKGAGYVYKCTACNLGTALNSSNTCSVSSYSVGNIAYHKGTAIGVVYYVGGNGKDVRIVALSDINSSGSATSTSMKWMTSSSNVSGLTDITNSTTAGNDMTGKANTDAIVTKTTAMAALATRKYAPSACATASACGKNQWYLPSLGEMKSMYNNKSTLTTAISNAGGTALGSSYYYWTSTEYGSSYAWRLYWSSGATAKQSKTTAYYVRPSLRLDMCGFDGAYEFNDSQNKCVTCSWGSYTLTSCPTGGTCSSKTCGGTTKYQMTGCDEGYTASGSSCVANTCSGYTLSSCPSNGNCSNCKSGSSYKYKLDSCDYGYTQSGNTCTGNDCSAYPDNWCPTNGDCDYCYNGSTYKYKFNGCYSGYSWDSSEEKCCNLSADGYTLSSCPSNAYCYEDTCKGVTKYQFSYCYSGYEYNGSSCIKNDCSAYPLSSCPAHGSCSECRSGSTTTYVLNSCYSPYTKNGNSCSSCSWDGYTLDACPTHANSCYSSTCGGITKYSAVSCENGYDLTDTGGCSICLCGGNGKSCRVGCAYVANYNTAYKVGVVFYVSGSTIKAVTPMDYDADYSCNSTPSGGSVGFLKGTDMSGLSLSPYSSYSSAASDTDGYSNYNAYVTQGSSCTNTQDKWCCGIKHINQGYSTSRVILYYGSDAYPGKLYVPSYGEMLQMHENIDLINQTLSSVSQWDGGEGCYVDMQPLQSTKYWTTTPYQSKDYVIGYDPVNDSKTKYSTSTCGGSIRLVFEVGRY